MGFSPQELVSYALALLVALAGVLATWLSRRGKREETLQAIEVTEQQRRSTAFAEVQALAELRRVDNLELRELLKSADAELARVRAEWEARWDRQMERCRKITDSATAAVTRLQRAAMTSEDRDAADETLRDLEQHRETDHPK